MDCVRCMMRIINNWPIGMTSGSIAYVIRPFFETYDNTFLRGTRRDALPAVEGGPCWDKRLERFIRSQNTEVRIENVCQ